MSLILNRKKLILFSVLAFLFVSAGFPSYAAQHSPASKKATKTKSKVAHLKGHKQSKTGKQKRATTGEKRTGIFTAYSATLGKGRPRGKTSSGTSLKERPCTVANNSLPIGTEILIEGIGKCEVHDRIGKKTSSDHFDIHLNDSSNEWAKNFGKRKLKYTIVKKQT